MKKRPRIILHLGTSKCGSTSLQYFLHSNQEALRAHRVLVPQTARGGVNHNGLALYVGRNRKWPQYARMHGLTGDRPDDFSTFFETQLSQEIEDAKPDLVVFSFEGLFRWADPQIDKLMGLLYRLSDDVHALATLRRHDRWAVSSYNTRLVGHGTASPDQLTNRNGEPHGILCAQQLKKWGAHMPPENLKVLSFDDHPDILAAHLGAMGLGRLATPQAVRKNVGISAYGQSVLLRYNQIREADGIHPDKQAKTRRRLKFVLPTGTPLLPSAQDVERHKNIFESDREALRRHYLKPDSRFFDDLVEYPEERVKIDISDQELADWLKKAEALPEEELQRRRGELPL